MIKQRKTKNIYINMYFLFSYSYIYKKISMSKKKTKKISISISPEVEKKLAQGFVNCNKLINQLLSEYLNKTITK